MAIQFYAWLWFEAHPRRLARRLAYLLLLSIVLLGPLLYLNMDLIRKGYRPSQSGFNIEAPGNPNQMEYYMSESDD